MPFVAENRRYVELGVDGVDKLIQRFLDDERPERLLHNDWNRLVANDILLLPQENARDAEERLAHAANVGRLGRAFWAQLEPQLALHYPRRR